MSEQSYGLALPLGTELNHYQIEAVLGQGGFGIVYRAQHQLLHETVVIKEFLPVELASRHGTTVQPHGSSRADLYQDCLARFLAEGRTLVKLRHPNVVRCRDLFSANGTAYLVMDFEDGLALDQLVKSLEAQGARYNEAQLLHFALPLAEGLAYIHQQGVLHRDIKPGNVFIRRADGSPVIIDFGAAKQNYAEVSQSQAPYTEFYAPLEQIEGSGDAKPTVDIHAFGALLYRLVTGSLGPRAEKRAMALLSGQTDPLTPAAALAKGNYSSGFLDTIDQCLAFRAEQRPQSMHEVKARLQTAPDVGAANAQQQQQQPQAQLERLIPLIEMAGADGIISQQEMDSLLVHAQQQQLSIEVALPYILHYAIQRGWSIQKRDDEAAAAHSSTVDDDVQNSTQSVDARVSLSSTLQEQTYQLEFERFDLCMRCERQAQPGCAQCQHTGLVRARHTVPITVPRGVQHGSEIKLGRRGDVSPDGHSRRPLVVRILLDDEAMFQRQESDLISHQQIDCPRIEVGQSYVVQGLGQQLRIRIPEQYRAQEPIRLRGQGLYRAAGSSSARGDLLLYLSASGTAAHAPTTSSSAAAKQAPSTNSARAPQGFGGWLSLIVMQHALMLIVTSSLCFTLWPLLEPVSDGLTLWEWTGTANGHFSLAGLLTLGWFYSGWLLLRKRSAFRRMYVLLQVGTAIIWGIIVTDQQGGTFTENIVAMLIYAVPGIWYVLVSARLRNTLIA